MFQFHGSLHLCVLTVVVFHELGIAIGFPGGLYIFLIVEQKGKPGMVPCLIDPVKIQHELCITGIGYGGTGREERFQGGIVAGQQFFKRTVNGPEQTHIIVYRVA